MRSAVVATAALAIGGCSAKGGGEGADEVELRAAFEWDYDLTQTGGTACGFTTTHLFDRSTGEPTAWLWEFPDGSVSTEQDLVIESRRVWGIDVGGLGDRMVTLTIYRDDESDSVSQQVFIDHC